MRRPPLFISRPSSTTYRWRKSRMSATTALRSDEMLGPVVASAYLSGVTACRTSVESFLVESSHRGLLSQLVLPPHETLLLPLVKDLVVPFILPTSIEVHHQLICLLSRYTDVGGQMEERSRLAGATTTYLEYEHRQGTFLRCSSPADAIASVVHLLDDHRRKLAVEGGNEMDTSSVAVELSAQVSLMGLCAARGLSGQSIIDRIYADLSLLTQPLPSHLFSVMLSLAPPRGCAALMEHQKLRYGHHLREMNERAKAMVEHVAPMVHTTGWLSDGDVAIVWRALLNNDYFFVDAASHAKEVAAAEGTNKRDAVETMHDVFISFVDAIPIGSVVVHSNACSRIFNTFDWSAMLNKLSRVYLKRKAGLQLYEVHQKLWSKLSGLDLRVPHTYVLRLVGAIYDEMILPRTSECSIRGGETGGTSNAWDSMLAVTRWALPLFSGSVPELTRGLLHLCRRAALAAEPVESTHGRLLQCYYVFLSAKGDDSHQSQSMTLMDKDSFHHLIRVHAEAIELQHVPPPLWLSSVLQPLLQYLELDTSIKFMWILDATVSLLHVIMQQYQLQRSRGIWSTTVTIGDSDISSIAQTVVDAVDQRILPARNAAGVSARSVAKVRKILEDIKSVDPSHFWWTCGCGAENAAESTHCGRCMRRARVLWICPSCHTEHAAQVTDRALVCGVCHSLHPRAAEADRHGLSFCLHCRAVLDPDLGFCRKCEPELCVAACSDQISSNASVIGGSPTAVTCTGCGERSLSSSNTPICPACCTVNPATSVSLWLCSSCNNFSHNTWSTCQRCTSSLTRHGQQQHHHRSGAIPKSVNALTVDFFSWVCGCGARNHPCRLSCRQCGNQLNKTDGSPAQKQGRPAFTCVMCRQPSDCRSRKRLPYIARQDAPTTADPHPQQGYTATLCQHCHALHPRDQHVLELPKAVLRLCLQCGHHYLPSKGDGRTAQVCTRCHSLQTVNPNIPFLCTRSRGGITKTGDTEDESDTASSSPSSRSSNCHWSSKFQFGVRCHQCSTLRGDVDDESLFVWKCVAETHGANNSTTLNGSGGEAAGESNLESCESWNFSWMSECKECDAPRRLSSSEVRARYIPWTCDSCGATHDATTVLICPSCDEGFQVATPCERCGLRHVALQCPTQEQLLEAERQLCVAEGLLD